GYTSTQESRPRVRTSPPSIAVRNLAGNVRRFFSSSVCSNSPSSMGPRRPTVPHNSPLYNPGVPFHPFGEVHGGRPHTATSFGVPVEDENDSDDPAVRMLLRGAQRRGVRPAHPPPRTAARRGRIPGDLPPRPPGISLAPPRRVPPRMGPHDRSQRRR